MYANPKPYNLGYFPCALTHRIFVNDEELTTLVIDNTIENTVFGRCSGIKAIIIKNNVTTFDGYLDYIYVTKENFINNSSLSETDNDYWGATILDEETTDGVCIKDNEVVAFRPLNKKGSAIIPDGVTTIGDYAFSNHRKLTGITIPEGVTTIGDYAFFNCQVLKDVVLPSTITSIGGFAFSLCKLLTEITIKAITPPTLSYTNTFFNALETIYVPADSVETYKTATNWTNVADKIQAINE